MTRRPTRQNLRSRLSELSGPGIDGTWPETVEVVGVSASPTEEAETETDDERDADRGDETDADGDDGEDRAESRPSFTISIPSPTDREDDEDAARDGPAECETCGLNPRYPALDGECVACAGMPRRDWPDHITDPDAEGGDHE
jgi:hypothetical protein